MPTSKRREHLWAEPASPRNLGLRLVAKVQQVAKRESVQRMSARSCHASPQPADPRSMTAEGPSLRLQAPTPSTIRRLAA